jgi:hypothetical protein
MSICCSEKLCGLGDTCNLFAAAALPAPSTYKQCTVKQSTVVNFSCLRHYCCAIDFGIDNCEISLPRPQ